MGKALAIRRAELLELGNRMVSTGGWRMPLVEEHLRTHLGGGPSGKWCRVECMAKVFFGRNTPTNRLAVRRRLSRAFRVLLMQRRLFLVIEYAQGKGAHGEALACKLYQAESEAEHQYAREQLRKMREQGVLKSTQVRVAEDVLAPTLPGETEHE